MMQTCNLFHNFLYLLALAVSTLFYFILLTLPVKLAARHNSLRQITDWPLFYPPNHDTQQKTDHNSGNYVPCS